MNSADKRHAMEMNSTNAIQLDVLTGLRLDDRVRGAGHLDLQFAELIEVVWACERRWKLENRIEAAIQLEGQHSS